MYINIYNTMINAAIRQQEVKKIKFIYFKELTLNEYLQIRGLLSSLIFFPTFLIKLISLSFSLSLSFNISISFFLFFYFS